MNKKGQMKLSFGMIVSIILIIFFLAFAFYAIQKFLGWNDTGLNVNFKNDLQTDITTVWRSSESNRLEEYRISNKVKRVCFVDDGYENFVLTGEDGKYIVGYNLKHVDFDTTIISGNSFCFDDLKGKVSMILRKDFGEVLISIKKPN